MPLLSENVNKLQSSLDAFLTLKDMPTDEEWEKIKTICGNAVNAVNAIDGSVDAYLNLRDGTV